MTNKKLPYMSADMHVCTLNRGPNMLTQGVSHPLEPARATCVATCAGILNVPTR
jgi:hypothetical protein